MPLKCKSALRARTNPEGFLWDYLRARTQRERTLRERTRWVQGLCAAPNPGAGRRGGPRLAPWAPPARGWISPLGGRGSPGAVAQGAAEPPIVERG